MSAPRRYRAAGEGNIDNGYKVFVIEGRKVGEHVLIAERALGKRLPKGAQVHHMNEDRSDNRPGNLVVCPSRAYHALLHVRQAALDACGNPSWRKCTYCKTYDDMENLGRSNGGAIYHVRCRNDHNIAQRRVRTEAAKPEHLKRPADIPADWRRCAYCRKFDALEALSFASSGTKRTATKAFHGECRAAHRRAEYAQKRAA